MVTYNKNKIKHHLFRAGTLLKALNPADGGARDLLKFAIRRRMMRYGLTGGYTSWLRKNDTPGPRDISALKAAEKTSKDIQVVATFNRESAPLAAETAKALKASVGQRWKATFHFADDCDVEHISAYGAVASGDARFNATGADESVAAGDAIVFLRSGAIPRPHGLYSLNKVLAKDPALAVVYSDEDTLDASREPSSPWFKPDFSPLLAKQGFLLGGMTALRVPAAEPAKLTSRLLSTEAEQFMIGMALEAGETGVGHIPHVLFHNGVPPRAPLPLPLPALPEPLPIVSILIPTRDGWTLLGPCLESLKQTRWPKERFEIIVIDNGSTDSETLEGLGRAEREGRIRIVRAPGPFNYSRLNNMAARSARGDLLVLLNNDTEVIDADWLRKLASHAMQPGTGAVGPKLLYPDRTVQHGGVIGGASGVAGHAHLLLGENEPGYNGLANLTHEVLAVTAACLAVSKKNYQAVGGLREELRVAFNDVVFCLDLHKHGLRNVYYAEALLFHHESKTRGHDDTPQKRRRLQQEAKLARALHGDLIKNDPFYSPNLALEFIYELAVTPRRRPLWHEN